MVPHRFEGYEYIDVVEAPATRTNMAGHWVCEDKEVCYAPYKNVTITDSPSRTFHIVHGTHGPVRDGVLASL